MWRITMTSFNVGTDASGKRFVFQRQREFDKNLWVQDHPSDTTGKGLMYETKLHNYPVRNCEKYMIHLHLNYDAMW